MSTQGTATVDFGNGATDVTVAVTGQASITTSNLVEAWIAIVSTANNTADNAWVEDLEIDAGNVVNATGFTIYAKCNRGRAFGQYKVNWVWN